MNDKNNIKEFLSNCSFDGYQPLEVDGKIVTARQDRSQTAKTIFSQNINNLSVLDVGCAYGFFCEYAKKKGAGKVVGLEPRKERFEIAQKLLNYNKLDIEYHNVSLSNYTTQDKFDYVLLLNVIHHVTDPIEIMRRCAYHSKKLVCVEFATVNDKRLIKGSFINKMLYYLISKRSFIGIGPDVYKTTFYFTKSSFRLLFCTHLGLFKSIEFFPSSTGSNRLIALCYV